MDRTNRNTGLLGERIAEKFLRSRKYVILEKNYTTPFGEIDIIGRIEGYTVFVEVKTRTAEDFASAEDAVTMAKKNRMHRAAQYFLKEYKIENRPCRFDVVTITIDPRYIKTTKHYTNVFTPRL